MSPNPTGSAQPNEHDEPSSIGPEVLPFPGSTATAVADSALYGLIAPTQFLPTGVVLPPEVVEREQEVIDLGDRIVTLSAQIQAATYELLVMIRRLDEIGYWGVSCRSCAHWLNWRTGLNLGAAREKVRVARALPNLPKISDAMRRGELSYSKVRALTRVATAQSEERLLEFAMAGTAYHVERFVRSWRLVDRLEEAARDEHRARSRSLSVYVDLDGMVVVRGRLDPETGAVFMRALEAASDRLYERARAEAAVESNSGPNSGDTRAVPAKSGTSQAPADDIAAAPAPPPGHPLEPALNAVGPLSTRDIITGDSRPPREVRQVDALALVAESALAADLDPGTRGDRYQVVLHVDAEVLKSVPAAAPDAPDAPDDMPDALDALELPDALAAPDTPHADAPGPTSADRPAAQRRDALPSLAFEPGMATLDDAIGVSAETSRRFACDSALVTMIHGRDGTVLDVGRRTRSIPPALRRALEYRDRTCRFPGCNARVCDAHHVEHWADGGRTKLDNLLYLCRRHHRLVHEGLVTVELLPDGQALFFHACGFQIPATHPPPALPAEPAGAMVDNLAENGVLPGPKTGVPYWMGEPADYGLAISLCRQSDSPVSGCRAPSVPRKRRKSPKEDLWEPVVKPYEEDPELETMYQEFLSNVPLDFDGNQPATWPNFLNDVDNEHT